MRSGRTRRRHDNCVSFLNRKLQIPESPLRPHFVKARVKVHRYPGGSLAVFHGRRCLGRYDSKGVAIGEARAEDHKRKAAGPSASASRRAQGCQGRFAPDAVTSPALRPPLTAPPRVARSHVRSAPGDRLTVHPGNARRRHHSSRGQARAISRAECVTSTGRLRLLSTPASRA